MEQGDYNAFYYKIARTWNDLPRDVVEVDCVNTFKNKLDELWMDDPSRFDHKS